MALHRLPITGLVTLLGLLCSSAVLAESPTRLAELRISVATGSQKVKISGQHSLMMPNPGRKLLQGSECSDKVNFCGLIYEAGLCSGGYVAQGMPLQTYWCPESCGACGSADCADKLTYCSSWKASGYCDWHYVYQGKAITTAHCKSTCGKCGGTPSPNPGKNNTGPVSGACNFAQGMPSSGSAQQQLLHYLNEARKCAGAQPLCSNPQLAKAALEQAQFIASSGQVVHKSQDGSPIYERVIRSGFQGSVVGEIVNKGSAPSSYTGMMGDLAGPHHKVISERRFNHGAAAVVGDVVVYVLGSSSQSC